MHNSQLLKPQSHWWQPKNSREPGEQGPRRGAPASRATTRLARRCAPGEPRPTKQRRTRRVCGAASVGGDPDEEGDWNMKSRDRSRELRRVPARELVPHPKHWRSHPPAQQDALRGLLTELGYCDAVLARPLPDGRLQLIDGRLRCETTPDMDVPVLVLDVSEAEADKLLATLDPLASLAQADRDALTALLASVDTDSAAVQAMLTDLAAGALTPFVDPGEVPGLTDPDAIPEPPDQATTQPGELCILGAHRLLCGDSAIGDDVDRLLAGAAIHLVITDPPYGVNVE